MVVNRPGFLFSVQLMDAVSVKEFFLSLIVKSKVRSSREKAEPKVSTQAVYMVQQATVFFRLFWFY